MSCAKPEPSANTSPTRGPFLPEVTVIVPALNAAATIASCLESLLGQDYPPQRYRVIVVDNNSSDDTPALVRRFPVELAFEREVQSPGGARNRGITLADEDILAFIDSDCVAEEDWLLNLMRPFRDPAVGAAGGRIGSQVPQSSLVERFLAQVKVSDHTRYSSTEPMGFPSGNVAYRRTALERVGPFDGAMSGGEDVDLAWRVQAYGGYRGVYVPDAVVHHKHRSSLAGVFRQYRGYGFSEIVLTALYRGQAFHRRTPAYQIRGMSRQVRALGTYCLSFVVRLARWRRWRSDRMYLVSPLLWWVLDSGYLAGKIEGLVKTRFFRRNPYAGQPGAIDRSRRPVGATPHDGPGDSQRSLEPYP